MLRNAGHHDMGQRTHGGGVVDASDEWVSDQWKRRGCEKGGIVFLIL